MWGWLRRKVQIDSQSWSSQGVRVDYHWVIEVTWAYSMIKDSIPCEREREFVRAHAFSDHGLVHPAIADRYEDLAFSAPPM